MHHISLSMTKKCELKLLGTKASPFVNRVQIVLKLKSIEYEYIEENLARKSELLLTSNPVHKKVPVLLHAKKSPIPESLIIIEYLDEIHPDVHQILPKAPLARADNRFWAFYIDNTLFRLYEELRQTPGKEGKEAVKKQIFKATELLEGAYVKYSNGKPYFGGDDLSYLDIALGCFLPWTGMIEVINDFKVFDEVRTPGLATWAKCMRSHEAIKSVFPGEAALTNLYMMLQKYKPPREV